MLKAVFNALFLSVLFVLYALGQAGAFHSDGGLEPQGHTVVVTPDHTAILAMELRADSETHGVHVGMEIIAEVETAKEEELRLEPSTVYHHQRYFTNAHADRSSVSTQRSAILNASVNPAYLAAALPAFVRFQVFRIWSFLERAS